MRPSQHMSATNYIDESLACLNAEKCVDNLSRVYHAIQMALCLGLITPQRFEVYRKLLPTKQAVWEEQKERKEAALRKHAALSSAEVSSAW